MADEHKKDDAEELDIAPVQGEEEDQNRDRGRRSDEMPREDADQDAQIRQSGDGNVHLGSQRDPSAETTEARRASTFDNQDTLDAVSRNAEEGEGLAEGEDGQTVNFDAEVSRAEGRGGDGESEGGRGGDGAARGRGQEGAGASEAARAGAPGQGDSGSRAEGTESSANGLNPLGRGSRGESGRGSASTQEAGGEEAGGSGEVAGETGETDTRDRSDDVVEAGSGDEDLVGGGGQDDGDTLTTPDAATRSTEEGAGSEDTDSDARPARSARDERIGGGRDAGIQSGGGDSGVSGFEDPGGTGGSSLTDEGSSPP